jgi:hypothetical protein
MSARRNRPRLGFVLVLSAAPLFAVGPCTLIAEQAVINGFFDAVNPLLLQRVEDALGLSGQTTTGSTAGNTTAAGG